MNRTTILIAAGLALAAALQSSQAQAQLLRTFVSAATGIDTNSCDRTVPCRTFTGALAKTLAGGEIYVLDPGGYGIVTITQPVSIVSDGAGGGIRVNSGATGITISAGVNDVINLRGLIIDGTGAGITGIQFNTGKSLTIENSVVRGLTGSGVGILFAPNASSSLAVSNTLVADNSARGIRVQSTGSGTVKASFNRVELYNNGNQALVVTNVGTGTVNAVVTDSVAANNTNDGFAVNTVPTAGPANLLVVRSVSANNVNGLFIAGANATLRIGQSTLTGNTNASWSVSGGGTLRSYGDNNIDGNADGDPVIPTIIAKK